MDLYQNYPLPDWTLGFEHRLSSVSRVPYKEYTGPLEMPASNTNSYRLIRLPNNLVVMCVHDAATETAAAALSVKVGSNMDPVDLQGLAHLLEHMLFMGTEKYPDEEEFSSFLNENSGYFNAWTQFSSTAFYFGIANDALEGALDRFSSLFTRPLIGNDCIDRELCAVDSEYKGHLNDDFRRSLQIECKLSNSGHPYSKFSVGSIETLKQSATHHGLDLREELLKFYDKYYSASIMKLVVCGNHSIDQLVEWTVSKFSEIKDKGDNIARNIGHPVSAEFLGKVVYYETVNETHNMNMTFPVPEVKALYRNDPLEYLSHLIGHEAQGSILAYLKQKGWATGLSAYACTYQDKGFNEFKVSICATPDGLERFEDILRVVFAYIRMLVTEGPQEWVQEEMSLLLKTEFDNKDKAGAMDWVLDHVDYIHNEYVTPEHSLSKDRAYEMFNPNDILHCLSFINPSNFRVFLGARRHKLVNCSEIEPYFGASYHVSTLSDNLLSDLASDNLYVSGLSLPEKNQFMPTDFTIKSTKIFGVGAKPMPTLLKFNDNFELWFKQDSLFNSPKGAISLSIHASSINSTPQNWVMSSLYCSMLSSDLAKNFYDATCAGLRFRVYSTASTIEMTVAGFSSKLPMLLRAIIERAASFKVDETLLPMYTAEHRQTWASIGNDPPSRLCALYKGYITSTSRWHHRLLECELAKITLAKLQAHVNSLFDATRIQMSIVGNFDEAEALNIANNLQAIFKPMSNLRYDLGRPREYKFEPGYYVYQMQLPNKDCVNSAVECSIYCGPATDKRETILLAILEELVHDNFFVQLRTRYQLGYSISALSFSNNGGRSKLVLRVEGEYNPMYVTMHINKFICDMQQTLLDISDEQFNHQAQLLIKQYQGGFKNIDEEAERYIQEVRSGAYDFMRYDKMAELLQSIEKEELLVFWNKYINPSTAPAYTRIDVQMWSAKIWRPTVSDFKEYSAKTLALYGCLHSEGNVEFDMGKVNAFLATAIAARQEQPDIGSGADALLAELKSATLSESGAVYAEGKSKERATHTSTALDLAIRNYETFGNYTNVSRTNFATIGMDKTPDGLWIMADYKKLQATQEMYGSDLPVEVFVPEHGR
ncbi:metalloprotease [Coemansia sp. IMI 209128]|nr:metalloprotease [Coemansia sp. IMI 209128]